MLIDTWVTVFWRHYTEENGDRIVSHMVDVNDCKENAISSLEKHYSNVNINLNKLQGSCYDSNNDKWHFCIFNKLMYGDQRRDTHAIFGIRK